MQLTQHRGGERSHGVELAPGAIPLAFGHTRLPDGGRTAARDGQSDESRGGQAQAMPGRELPHPIRPAVGRGQHGPAFQVALQIVGQLIGATVAPLGILAQRLEDDAIDVGVDRAGRSRFLHADGVDQLRVGARHQTVRATPRGQAIQQHAERVHVRGRGDRFAAQLLRAGTFRRDHPNEGRFGRRVGLEHLRDAEVQQFRDAVAGHEDVRRLDVAVHDQMLVRVVHRQAHTPEQVDLRRRSSACCSQ